MKKILTIVALLCASMMGWAGSTPYCNVTSPNANFTFSLMNVSGNLYRIQFDAIGDVKFASTPYNNNCGVNQTEGAGIAFGNDGWIMTDDRAYKDFTTATSTSVPTGFFGNYFCFNKKGGGLIEITSFNPSDVDWSATCGASCSDSEVPVVSAVSVGSITYNSAVLTITASDNVAVTRYVVKNGDTQIAQGTSHEITLTGLTSGTTYDNIKVFAYDACNNESSAFSTSSFITEDLTYCRYATGHLANPNFGDIYGRILLTIKKVDNSTIAVRVEPNNNGTKGIKYLNIIVNGVGHEYGNNDGSGDDLTGFYNISGLESLDFTININFYCNTPNWTTNSFSVTKDQLCTESPMVLTDGSEYCDEAVACARNNGAYAYLSWNTTEDGDVLITINDGTGSTNAAFRGNGIEGDFDAGFKVLSGADFATEEVASKYFTRVLPSGAKKTFTLLRKGGITLPSPAKIKFTGVPAIAWTCTQDGDGYGYKAFEYTYGTICSVASGYAVSASANDGTMGAATAKVGDDEVDHVEAGTTVTFTAAANDTYTFVNWTKGGVEVSTNPVYEVEINEATALVANFDYVRNTYCHTEVTSAEGKKFYMTIGSIGNGQYQIKFEGSAEAKITGLNDANFQINGVSAEWDTDGVDVPFSKANEAWIFDASGYGSYKTTFELASNKTWKDIYAWTHYMYFACEGLGQQTLTDAFPNRYRIAWNEICADAEAPVLANPTAVALNTTDVRLTLSATDNWEGFVTYNVTYKPTGAEGDGTTVTPAPTAASGDEITCDITGLTTNTEYTFTVTAKDAADNVCVAKTCTATPSGDSNAPTNVTITATALTNTVVRLTLSADDDFAGDISYAITYDNEGSANTSAPQGESVTLDITGLTANTDYHFAVVATDVAGNPSAAVSAETVHTYAANLAYKQPTEAGATALPKAEGNDGNKGSRWASGASATHSDNIATSQDWWYVDLGAVYDIKNIRMYWEGARPSKYKFFTSIDAESWTEIANVTVSPRFSANASEYMDYLNDLETNAQGRYLKVWGYEDKNNNWAYGISFWELEAYGTLATDAVAPVISSFTADGASSSSVLLKATADDNFKGNLTYTFYCDNVAQPNPLVAAANEEVAYTVSGLTMGIDYNFKVVVSDGTNSTTSEVVVGSPIGDSEAPTNVSVATKSVADHEIVLTLSATDNLGGMIYYIVTTGEIVKNAQALSGEDVDVTFDEGINYSTTYNFSIVAKDGSNNAAATVTHRETTLRASYPTSAAPTPAFNSENVAPVYSSAYIKNCNFADWGGSGVTKETYGAKKNDYAKAFFGIVDFGTISVDATDELHMHVWTDQDNIQFRIVPIIHNEAETANLPERGALTQPLVGGQWNEVRIRMSDFVLDGLNVSDPYENYDRIYQIKIDNAGNQTFWLDNIYFSKHVDVTTATITQDWLTEHNGECMDLDVDRPMTADTYFKTLCLPFSMSAEQIAETFGDCELLRLKEAHMKSETDMYVGYERVNTIEAGYPYLITLFGSENLSKLDFSGVTINSATTNNTITVDAGDGKSVEMVGTFVSITRSANEDFYLDAADNLLHSIGEYCSENSVASLTIPAFRCYFRLIGFSNPSSVSARVMHWTEVATYLEKTAESETSMRIEKLMRDGQLFIIRDGKMYTVTGLKVE